MAPVVVAKVLDFGIASLPGGATDSRGTVGVLSPEQARSDPVVPASDVYSLAATIHAAHTGRSFFEDVLESGGMNAFLIDAHATREPLAKTPLQGPLAALLQAATRLDPAARIGIEELAEGFAAM